jgi:hypothetical protein
MNFVATEERLTAAYTSLRSNDNNITAEDVTKMANMLLFKCPRYLTLSRPGIILASELVRHPLITSETFHKLFTQIEIPGHNLYMEYLHKLPPQCENVIFELYMEGHKKATKIVDSAIVNSKNPKSRTKKWNNFISHFFAWYSLVYLNDVNIQLTDMPKDMALDMIGWK